MVSDTLDPVQAKNEHLQIGIDAILHDVSLLEEHRKALMKLDTWFVKKKLKRNSRKTYLGFARTMLRSTQRLPDEWIPEDIPDLMSYWDKDGPVARNTGRTVLRHFLQCYKRPKLLRMTRVAPEETDEPLEMSVASSMKSEIIKQKGLQKAIRPDWTEITEMHIRGLTALANPNLAAILWVIWDTGGRPDDICTLKLRDVKDFGEFIVLMIEEDTKTGARAVPLNYSMGIFKRYLASHPYRFRDNQGNWKNPDVALFLNTRGKPYTSNGSLKPAFRYLKERVIKRQNEDPEWPFPHIPEELTLQDLRPNAVSRDRNAGMTAEESAEIRGHDVKVAKEFYDKSDKAKHAVRAIAKTRGIEWTEDETPTDPWIDCPKCNHPNPPSLNYCTNCGDPISPQAIRQRMREERMRIEKEAEESILKNHELIDQFAEMQKQMKALMEKVKELEDDSPS